MSVTAHYTEQYVIIRHFPFLNFRWLVLGSAFPDALFFDRILMFTVDLAMHRDYLFGWFHSLSFPLAIAIVVFFIFGKMPGISFLIGGWLHVLTDTLDVLGIKLFWPFIEKKFSVGIFPWTDGSILYDLRVYFTTPLSAAFEVFFLVWAILIVRKFKGKTFFHKILYPWTSSSWTDKKVEPSTTPKSAVQPELKV